LLRLGVSYWPAHTTVLLVNGYEYSSCSKVVLIVAVPSFGRGGCVYTRRCVRYLVRVFQITYSYTWYSSASATVYWY